MEPGAGLSWLAASVTGLVRFAALKNTRGKPLPPGWVGVAHGGLWGALLPLSGGLGKAALVSLGTSNLEVRALHPSPHQHLFLQEPTKVTISPSLEVAVPMGTDVGAAQK